MEAAKGYRMRPGRVTESLESRALAGTLKTAW